MSSTRGSRSAGRRALQALDRRSRARRGSRSAAPAARRRAGARAPAESRRAWRRAAASSAATSGNGLAAGALAEAPAARRDAVGCGPRRLPRRARAPRAPAARPPRRSRGRAQAPSNPTSSVPSSSAPTSAGSRRAPPGSTIVRLCRSTRTTSSRPIFFSGRRPCAANGRSSRSSCVPVVHVQLLGRAGRARPPPRRGRRRPRPASSSSRSAPITSAAKYGARSTGTCAKPDATSASCSCWTAYQAPK